MFLSFRMHKTFCEWPKYVVYFKALENRTCNGFHSFTTRLNQGSQIKCVNNSFLISKYLPSHSSKSIYIHKFNRTLCVKNNALTNHDTNRNRGKVEDSESPELHGHQMSQTDGDRTEENETNTNLYECIDYDAITEGDSESLNKFKLLLLEVEVMRQDGQKVPKQISTEKWKELFSLKTRSQRMKLLNFLWTVEVRKLGDQRRKERKQLAVKERFLERSKLEENNDHIRYGLGENTIFIRLYDQKVNSHDNQKLVQAMMFGHDIVIDCSYEKDMSPMENSLCVKQLLYMFAENRLEKEPFNLHFCSLNRDGILFKKLKKSMPLLGELEWPLNVTEEHYLNIFPKEKLVYLTPHCRTELQDFNHEDIYIIGAMVDKHNCAPLSLAKAKSEGIRMAQLPLDRYLAWGLGTKSLTVNQVLKILHDVRSTGNWNIALKNVPKRKLQPADEKMQDRRRFFTRGIALEPPPQHERRGTTFQPPPMNHRKRNIS